MNTIAGWVGVAMESSATWPQIRESGTVDTLQGRRALVVFVFKTAAAIAAIPRGMSFLLNRNRTNAGWHLARLHRQ
jgi:hypothetical protein